MLLFMKQDEIIVTSTAGDAYSTLLVCELLQGDRCVIVPPCVSKITSVAPCLLAFSSDIQQFVFQRGHPDPLCPYTQKQHDGKSELA